ncbi:MAG: hypothetical protein MUC75_08420 [Ignavibacteriaceae bacterium]|nr:hypothetical protein [Ignavibacteriaceae bacterium]
MKKLIILILLVAAGYFAYEYLIKEKTALEINADKSISTQYSMDADAPALAPAKFANIQGTVKNVSDKTVTNLKQELTDLSLEKQKTFPLRV